MTFHLKDELDAAFKSSNEAKFKNAYNVAAKSEKISNSKNVCYLCECVFVRACVCVFVCDMHTHKHTNVHDTGMALLKHRAIALTLSIGISSSVPPTSIRYFAISTCPPSQAL